jgi:lactobin A/cerein 7B family class IIb bacteriocin
MTEATLSAAARPSTPIAAPVFTRAGLPWYFALTFGWTWLCWGLVALSTRDVVSLPIPEDLLMVTGGLGPLVAAIIVVAAGSGTAGLRALFGQLLRWRVRPVWYAIAVFGWAAIDGILVLLNALAGGAIPLAPPLESWLSLPAIFLVTALLRGGIDEEVGWRGFALPALQARYGALISSLVLGLIWACWHIPLWFIGGTEQAGQSFLQFVPSVLMLSVVLAWLYNNTGQSLLLVCSRTPPIT